MSGHEQDTDIRDSTPDSTGPARAAGGMGVSSERVGPTGPGQDATDGVKDTSPVEPDPGHDLPAEQSAGRRRRRPRPRASPPAAGYPSLRPAVGGQAVQGRPGLSCRSQTCHRPSGARWSGGTAGRRSADDHGRLRRPPERDVTHAGSNDDAASHATTSHGRPQECGRRSTLAAGRQPPRRCNRTECGLERVRSRWCHAATRRIRRTRTTRRPREARQSRPRAVPERRSAMACLVEGQAAEAVGQRPGRGSHRRRSRTGADHRRGWTPARRAAHLALADCDLGYAECEAPTARAGRRSARRRPR